ncbi:MAG: CRISPR system precrRNA processing endoribonuclease RAMP protein Cas6 [Planctomycetes bacterium]|nr:CRISPR system precrRNA processing endoribonuclease RAMP protein Cas6 [Planctomycetota bacterium]
MASNELKLLTVDKLRFEIEFTSDGKLPGFLGLIFRGGFGAALHRSASSEDYKFLFASSDTKPFVWNLPELEAARAGDKTTFELVLIEGGVNFLDTMSAALSSLGESGLGKDRVKFSVRSCESVEPLAADRDFSSVRRVKIETVTPLALKHEGKVTHSVDFALLVGSVARRIELLTANRKEDKLNIDARDLLAKAGTVIKTEDGFAPVSMTRFSRKQEREMPVEGVFGSATFEGDIAPFATLLIAAEAVHVGRHTSFGLGRIAVKFEI